MRRADAETEAGPVGDARRHREADWMAHERIAGAATGGARLRPGFAAAPAPRARAAKRHLEGNDRSHGCIAPRQPHVDRENLGGPAIAQKPVADSFDEVADGRKVDRHFVGEAVVQLADGIRGPPYSGQRLEPKGIAAHGKTWLTIGAAPVLVKAAHGW